MITQERVYKFASSRLRNIFESMPLEDFMQEYECIPVDETTSYFPYALIRRLFHDNERVVPVAEFSGLTSYDEDQVAAFDVGRRVDTSELTVFGITKDDRCEERLFRTYRKVEFPEQEAELDALLSQVRRLRLVIDATPGSYGEVMVEHLEKRWGPRVIRCEFNGQSKNAMAVNYRTMAEQDRIRIFRDRERVRHIHSIRKIIRPGGIVKFDVVSSDKHHADIFWSQAMALYEANAHGTGESLEGRISHRSGVAVPGPTALPNLSKGETGGWDPADVFRHPERHGRLVGGQSKDKGLLDLHDIGCGIFRMEDCTCGGRGGKPRQIVLDN